MIAIRPASSQDAPDIARIHIDMWRLSYQGILSDEYLRRLSYSRSRLQWLIMIERHSRILTIAESPEDGIVGFAAGGAERTGGFGVDGELTSLYVLSSHQGKGVGRSLTSDMAQRLADHGREGMMVWVLADNPARGFYEHLGGKEVAEQMVSIGGREYREIAFLWRDLNVLTR